MQMAPGTLCQLILLIAVAFELLGYVASAPFMHTGFAQGVEKVDTTSSRQIFAGFADSGQRPAHREASSVANGTLRACNLVAKVAADRRVKLIPHDEVTGPLTYFRVVSIFSYLALACYVVLLLRESSCIGGDPSRVLEPTRERNQLRRILAVGFSVADASISIVRSLLQQVSESARKRFDGSAEDEELKCEAEDLRIKINRNCALCLFDILALMLIALTILGAHDGVWGDMDGSTIWLYIERWDYVGILYTFLACMIVVVRPSCVNSKTLYLYYLFGLVRVFLTTRLVQDCHILITAFPMIALSTFLGSLVCGDVWLTTCANISLSCLQCWDYIQSAETETGPFPRHIGTYIVYQGIFVCGTAFFCALEQWALTEYVRFSNSEAAVHRLLSVVCDAVVSIGPGPEFQIKRPTPQLATLLLSEKDNPHSFEGQSFLNLVSESDVSRFEDLSVRHERVQGSPPLSLRGADGNAVEVRLYFSSFKETDGKLGHIIGVCQSDLGASTPGCRTQASPPHQDLDTSVEQNSNAGEATNSADEDALPPLPGSGRRESKYRQPDIGAVIDAGTEQLRIAKYTPEFALLTGEVPDGQEGFLKWISDAQRQQFVTSVQGYANATLSGQQCKAPRFNVVLHPPLAVKLGFEIHAQCKLSVENIGNAIGASLERGGQEHTVRGHGGPGGTDSEAIKNTSDSASSSDAEDSPILMQVLLQKVRRRRLRTQEAKTGDVAHGSGHGVTPRSVQT